MLAFRRRGPRCRGVHICITFEPIGLCPRNVCVGEAIKNNAVLPHETQAPYSNRRGGTPGPRLVPGPVLPKWARATGRRHGGHPARQLAPDVWRQLPRRVPPMPAARRSCPFGQYRAGYQPGTWCSTPTITVRCLRFVGEHSIVFDGFPNADVSRTEADWFKSYTNVDSPTPWTPPTKRKHLTVR